MEQESLPKLMHPDETLPVPGQRVIVVCDGYRCLGYLDPDKVWRQDSNGERLQGVIAWYDIDT